MDKKICVIGAGYWGKNHIKTLSGLNALNGIVELDFNILKSVQNTYPNIKGHSSVLDSLNEDYDGYVIATPASTHFEIAKILIKAQKHILIEKPMTLSIDEAEELIVLMRWLAMCFYFILR